MTHLTRYGVILADPAWEYRNSGISGAANNHYPTMSDQEICDLPIAERGASDSLLLLWATWPKLDVAFDVIRAWGYKYKTGLPWIKLFDAPTTDLWGNLSLYPAAGQGWWIRGLSEPFLICTRGNIKPPDDPPHGLLADICGLISLRFRHSKKPENEYEYAELFPGPYLELFARRARPGWDVWGNEVASTVDLGVTP